MGAKEYLTWFFIGLAIVLALFYIIDHVLWAMAGRRAKKIIDETFGEMAPVHDYLIEYGKVKGTMEDVPFIIEIEGGQILLVFGKPGQQGSATCESLEEAFDILNGQVYLNGRVHG